MGERDFFLEGGGGDDVIFVFISTNPSHVSTTWNTVSLACILFKGRFVCIEIQREYDSLKLLSRLFLNTFCEKENEKVILYYSDRL